WATGPPRSASRSRAVPVAGGSSVAWCTTVTGWKSGTRSPGSSSAAERASVATSTARQRNSPCSAVVTEVVDTDVTRTPVCTVPRQRRRGGACVGRQGPRAAAALAVLRGGHRGGRHGRDPHPGVHGARRQSAQQQVRQRLGAALGQAEPSPGEGAQGEVGAPARRGEVRVAQQRRQQGAQEAVD